MKLQSGVGGVGSEPFALDSDMAEWFVMWGLVRGWPLAGHVGFLEIKEA